MNACLISRICFMRSLSLIPFNNSFSEIIFTGTELLGRLTDHSIMLKVVAGNAMGAYLEYGKVAGVYADETTVVASDEGAPFEILIDKLMLNTRYHYRLRYRERGEE